MMKNEILIKKLAEETIYTAKGHFKSSDIRRALVTFTIWFCMIASILGLTIENVQINHLLSIFVILGSVALLLWNNGDAKNNKGKHKEIAESYLSIHKELRDFYYLDKNDKDKLESISNRIKKMDKKDKPDITYLGRKWSKYAIEKDNETDKWYKEL